MRADCGHVTISGRALALLTSPAALRRLRVRYRADPRYQELVVISAVVLGYADATRISLAPDDGKAWLMTTEAAQRLGVGPPAVRRMLREGRLTGIKRGRLWHIDPASVVREAACLARTTATR